METKDALAALSALAQPMRLNVFRMLVRAGPDGLCAGDIAERLGALPNTLSSNLEKLAHAGLVESERDGRQIRYFAKMQGMQNLVAFLSEDCCGGRPEMCAPPRERQLKGMPE